jgi:hypothetical protein
MYNDKGSDEDLDIISSPESSEVNDTKKKTPDTSEDEEVPKREYIYDEHEHEQVRGFASIMSSEIYIVEVNDEAVFYSTNLGHARRQAYKLTQNIMFSQPTWYTYHIDQPNHNNFVLSGVSKCCLVSYDTPVATVVVRPLYRVRESQW